MGRINKFEDLICWQKSRVLVKEIYEISCYDYFGRDFALKDQLRKAAISIALNNS
ncbi:MAG: four helix bundle protein [Ignavibacteria bacterium]